MTQGQFTSSSCCVKYSIWLRIGSAFWLLGPQGQLSHKAHVRSEQFCTALITYPQAAAQTRRICLAFEVTDPCCFRATDKVVASSGSRDQDPTMVPGSITCYSYKAVPYYPNFLVLPLFIVLTSFFLSHFSTTYFLLLVSGALCL